jgi:hypothetical protein
MTLLTTIHVLISLIGIPSGIVVIAGFLTGNRFHFGNLLFLGATTAAVSAEFLNVLVLITQLFEKVPALPRYARPARSPSSPSSRCWPWSFLRCWR